MIDCWYLLVGLYILCGLGVFVILRLARVSGWALVLVTALWPCVLMAMGAIGITWDIRGRIEQWQTGRGK